MNQKFAITKAKKFVVKQGVPVPRRWKKRIFPEYPFAKMEVGDSFDIKVDDGERYYSYEENVYSAWRAWKAEHAAGLDIQFTKRRLNDEGIVRVWRIK